MTVASATVLIARLVAQDREFSHRPERTQRGARFLVAEIDEDRLKGNGVFVQGDERLVAERRERMVVKLERHDFFFPPRLCHFICAILTVARIYFAARTIQPTPNLSATMPKRVAKKVSVIGICT